MGSKKLSFEENMAELEKCARMLSEENISLEDAIKNFEKGQKYYEECSRILSEARQKIEVYTKDDGSSAAFSSGEED